MEIVTQIGRFALPLLGAAVLLYCLFSLYKNRLRPEEGASLLNSANGDKIRLFNRETSIGRGKACDIIFNYDTVSRSHAVVALRKKGWFVVDTRSSTGTYVNGEATKRKTYLNDGDVITLGGAVLVFKTGSIDKDISFDKSKRTL